MKSPLFTLFFILLLYIGSLDNASGQISLNDALQGAVENHPQLKVAKSDIAIAQAKLIDAGKLENPVFDFSLKSQLTDGPNREGGIFMGYSQTFPVTAKLLRQRDLGVATIRLACAEVLEVERNFVAEVQEAYIEAVGTRALIEELTRLEEDTEKSIELAKKQLAIAQGSELEVSSAMTEKILATQARRSAEAEFQKALAKLQPYLQMQPNESLELSQGLDSVIATLRPTIQTSVPTELRRSDIVAAEVRKERAQTDEKLACSEAVEDWAIAAGYESLRTVDEPVGVERDRFLGLGVKIPLPVRKKGEGRIAEARAETEKAQHELELARVTSRGQVATRIAAVRAAEKNLEYLGEQVLPQLKAREGKTRQAYGQGLLDFNQIILLQQQQSRTREAMAKAKLDKALAMAQLQHALGSNPMLKNYGPENCPNYKCGTEPKNAPWALPVLSPGIQAMPVSENEPAKKGIFQNWAQRLSWKDAN